MSQLFLTNVTVIWHLDNKLQKNILEGKDNLQYYKPEAIEQYVT